MTTPLIGRAAVIAIGQKIISIIRHKLMCKYGSTVCVQQHARNITEMQDLQRGCHARINVHVFRQHIEPETVKFNFEDYIKAINQIQAGNCGQMSFLTACMLEQIMPPGLTLESKCVKDPKDNESHQFVTIRPKDTNDPEQTLVIDPWPSNQLYKPDVVPFKDYYLEGKQMLTQYQHSNDSVRLKHTNLTTLNHVKYNDFNLSKLQKIEKLIDSKERINTAEWRRRMFELSLQPTQVEILMTYKDAYALFKHRRLDIRNVRKVPVNLI